MTNEWRRCDERLPEANLIVETKIDNEGGVRNKQPLVRYRGMWFLSDKSMYIYYSPTHWRPLS